ncbi:MAG: hypothetical protein ACYCXK_09580 [Candidatus Humimicrobiaceae bacterium]
MRIAKIILLTLVFFIITASVAFVLIKYQEERKLIAVDREDAEVAKILLSRVKDLKDVNEPVGVWDVEGNLLDVTDATLINDMGEITKVTKYEIFKDKYGNDVQVKLRRELEKTKEGNSIGGWVIDKPYKMLTKFYSGKIKEIKLNSIVFDVDSESQFEDFGVHIFQLKDVKDYKKIFNFNDYDLKKSKGFMIPPDCIEIGFKNMVDINDFMKYLNRKISVQESITLLFENSYESTTLSFKEYYY